MTAAITLLTFPLDTEIGTTAQTGSRNMVVVKRMYDEMDEAEEDAAWRERR